jgi:hypothetical protein
MGSASLTHPTLLFAVSAWYPTQTAPPHAQTPKPVMPAKAGIQNLGRATQNIVIAQSANVRRKSPANAGRLPPSLAEISTGSANRRRRQIQAKLMPC